MLHVVVKAVLSTDLAALAKKLAFEKTKRSGLSKTIVVYPNVFPVPLPHVQVVNNPFSHRR
jgi:hypothetical protein